MANVSWRGDAQSVAKVQTATPANVQIGDAFTLKLGDMSVSFTATVATVANVTAGLQAAWAAASYAPFNQITAADTGTLVTLTANTAGYDFNVTSSTTDGGGANTQTLTIATSTQNASNYDVRTAANWSGFAIPATTDNVYLNAGAQSPLYHGLDAGYVTYAGLYIGRGFNQSVGLPYKNAQGYIEYLPRYWQVGASDIVIGFEDSSILSDNLINRCLLDSGSVQTSLNILAAGTGSNGEPAVLWKGTHASNVVTLVKGWLGVAFYAGETSTIATLNVGQVGGGDSDAVAILGEGVTLTTVRQSSGYVLVNNGATTYTISGGRMRLQSGNVTTVNLNGGTVAVYGALTITTLTGKSGGTLDLSNANGTVTITNLTHHQGFRIIDPLNRLAVTNLSTVGGV